MNDRYAAPVSDVASPPPAARVAPAKLTLAVRLLWASLALGIPSLLMEADRAEGGVATFVSFAVQAAFFGLGGYLIVCIHRGANWARMVALVLTAAEAGVLLFGFTTPGETVIEAICNWIAAGLDVAAMWLLFASPAAGWFGKAPAELPD
jgi:hypothetical protein